MPIYDFKCNECGRQFDQLCRLNWEGTIKCPSCSQSNITKVISLISSHGRSTADNCGSCSGKSCSSCSSCK
ncbi:FmdB family zinc ribbon protein [Sporomusa carbonis]|uniref:FmdB family zinc ribbon protein n=1 Tax=Sporomusa carbonis TaxID=3076075 RepID=UPI003C7B1023